MKFESTMPGQFAVALTALVFVCICPLASADTLITLDGRVLDGKVAVDPSGGFQLQPTAAGAPVSIDPSQFLQVNFNPPVVSDEGRAMTGWFDHDFLEEKEAENLTKPGRASMVWDIVTIRAPQGLNPQDEPYHMSACESHGRSVFTVRLLGVRPAGAAGKAGLLLRRHHVDHNAWKSLFLYVNPSGDLAVQTWEGHEPPIIMPHGHVTFPVFLRVARQNGAHGKDQEATLLFSQDGLKWTQVADEKTDFGWGTWVGPAVVSPARGAASATATKPLIATFDQIAQSIPDGVVPLPVNSSSAYSPRGLLLRSGTFLANARVEGPTDGQVMVFRGPLRQRLGVGQLARVLFSPVSVDVLAKVPPATSGVLMSAGDFLEGQIKSLDGGTVKLSSVLLGIVNYRKYEEAAAVIFRDPGGEVSKYTVELTDGSQFQVTSLHSDSGALVVDEPTLGKLSFAPAELCQVRCNTTACVPLASLIPKEPVSGARASIPLSIRDPANGCLLSAPGGFCQTGVLAADQAPAAFDLGGAYERFRCRVAVPDVMATPAAQFVVIGDQKELYRGPAQLSGHPWTAVACNVHGIKTLALLIEPAPGASSPAVGIWGDAFLLK